MIDLYLKANSKKDLEKYLNKVIDVSRPFTHQYSLDIIGEIYEEGNAAPLEGYHANLRIMDEGLIKAIGTKLDKIIIDAPSSPNTMWL